MNDLHDLFPKGYIDAHHHIWAPDSRGDVIGYRWLREIGAPKPFGDPTPIQRDYLIDEFLSETALAPCASVHVQTDGALPDPVAETAWVQAEADRVGHQVAIVGLVDLSRDDAPKQLDRHLAHTSFRGVRQIVARLENRPDLSFASRDFLDDKQWTNGLRAVADRDLTFDMQIYPEQAKQALDVLASLPNLTVILDHAGCPYDVSPEGQVQWRQAVRAWARRPKTYVKLSGWGMYDMSWTGDSISPILRALFEEFGPERVMWGSNYPVEKLARSYPDMLFETAARVRRTERDWVFKQSAAKAYGLNLT